MVVHVYDCNVQGILLKGKAVSGSLFLAMELEQTY